MAAEPMTSAHVDWFLALTRLNAVRRRVEREGMTDHVAQAFTETIADLTKAAAALDVERTLSFATSVPS